MTEIKKEIPAINIHFHNKFKAILIDKEGKIKQEAYAENIVLNQFWTFYFTTPGCCIPATIQVGTNGAAPAATDTTLTNAKYIACSLISYNLALPTSSFLYKSTFPATGEYVGTFAEVALGLHLWSTYYISRALFTDSEGNAITITKADTDILIIEATQYIVQNFPINFVPADVSRNTLLYSLVRRAKGGSDYSYTQSCGPYSYGNSFSILSIFLYAIKKRLIYQTVNPPEYYKQYYDLAIVNGTSGTFNSAKTATNIRDVATKTQTFNMRLLQAYGNDSYVLAIEFPGYGYFALPNTDIFPIYTMENISVGLGDGSKINFECPIPYFKADTEIIYINGTALIRNTDYTIDNKHNRQKNFSLFYGQTASITTIGSLTSPATGIHTYCIPLFFGLAKTLCLYGLDNYGQTISNAEDAAIFMTEEEDLYFDLGTSKEVNYLKIIELYRYSDKLALTGVHFILSHSADGVTYTDYYTTTTFNASTGAEFAFTPYTARYWKLTFNSNGLINSNDKIGHKVTTMNQTGIIDLCRLGYVGDPIQFTTPPALNDIITMQCDMDLPFKNNNHVIDITMQFIYG